MTSSTKLTKNALVVENTQLRALMAKNNADHAAEVAMLHKKMHELNSARRKWEDRARTAQTRAVSTGSSFAERAAAARAEAMRTGKTISF